MSSKTTIIPTPYRGRFAPSPNGPLHFGSLVTALGSYLQAKSQGGEWLVRMEDLDPPRETPGAADDILRTLEAFHLFWDGSVLFQSQRQEAYEDTLDQLRLHGHSYPCGCSRKSITETLAKHQSADISQGIYPGTCREGLAPGIKARSVRLRVTQQPIVFHDRLQGTVETRLDRQTGDFVIKRADGYYAYHLAVVVDDAYQGITEIVRGIDLIGSTPHHIYLQQLMGLPTPHYAHLPIAVNQQGEKLSKQSHAPAIDTRHPGPLLAKALTFLGHQPDPDVAYESPDELIQWALSHWNLVNIPRTRSIPVGHY